MPSKKGCLPLAFGQFSKLPIEKIEEIRAAARVLANAHQSNDDATWQAIIKHANSTLTKHERGFFSALAMMMVESK